MSLKGKYAKSHWLVKITQWFGCMLLFLIPTMGCVTLFEYPLSVSALKWIQLLQTVAIFLLPPLCMAYLWATKPVKWLKLSEFASFKVHGSAVLLMLLALPAINLLGYLNEQMSLPAFLQPLEQWMKTSEQNAALLTEQFLKVDTMGGLIVNIWLMAFLPAVAEELTFRGLLQNILTPSKVTNSISKGGVAVHVAIWCVAIIFSAIHMQFYGFFPRMLMGALFGYMLIWTGSLWVPMLMHFTNNTASILLFYIAYNYGGDVNQMDAFGTGDILWLGIVSLILTMIGICSFRLYLVKKSI